MWVAKIKFSSRGTLIGEKASRYNLDIFGFPLSYTYEKNWVIVQLAGNIFGNNSDKKMLLRDLKKEKRVVNLERDKDFVIGTIKEPKYTNDLYQKEVFHLAPAYISSKGFEIIEIGSFNRKIIAKIIRLFEKRYNGELIFFKEKKINSISIMSKSPELTEKQKQAMNLAIKNGYYDYPRRISVEHLAKQSKLSFSTFHAHLRKAEQKLLPFYFER